ncbi:hypothetical protein JZ751_017106 [Albula glossodonta]|uniref:Uncharacterized protein n=1 Tax=Albula glossodonta TaxID=121402 RepID=A0A8T2NXG1_9TELE|nr:hypothetical protein JZ751_017106 [Albula glossodonta]
MAQVSVLALWPACIHFCRLHPAHKLCSEPPFSFLLWNFFHAVYDTEYSIADFFKKQQKRLKKKAGIIFTEDKVLASWNQVKDGEERTPPFPSPAAGFPLGPSFCLLCTCLATHESVTEWCAVSSSFRIQSNELGGRGGKGQYDALFIHVLTAHRPPPTPSLTVTASQPLSDRWMDSPVLPPASPPPPPPPPATATATGTPALVSRGRSCSLSGEEL